MIQKIILGQVEKIVITLEDRLLRFGSEMLFQICEPMDVEVLILKESPDKDFYEKLVDNVLAILMVQANLWKTLASKQERRSQ
jgi:predicted site-specific integrase-resolvase